VETLETLARRMETAQTLRDLVRTMKSLAAVSVRQYERSLTSLADYDRTIELGLRAVLREAPAVPVPQRRPAEGRHGVLVLGTDQGLCGTFNEQVVRRFQQDLDAGRLPRERVRVFAVGERLAERLREASLPPEATAHVPISVALMPSLVQDLLLVLDRWERGGDLVEAVLYHHRPQGLHGSRPHGQTLLPVPTDRLEELAGRPWPTRMVPRRTVDRRELLGAIARHSLAVTLHRAVAWSAASEHTSRLLAMQAAERNIDERLDELRGAYHTRRQTAITTEVLDIVAGADATPSTRAVVRRTRPRDG
jgi:F-type H+-transporting ATPase subunit gamma